MSTTVDERVVSMRFDNSHFEQNVRTSLATLQRLRQNLNLNGATRGLENVQSAARNIDMSPLSGAVETVHAKFSALEVIGMTALSNITTAAMQAGKNLVSAFTITPIKTGFQEYETQINAIQTIMANTQSKGTTLDDVNKALNELNHYADMTIYNFTEMTRNIGTFTAAGVDLKTSVSAIQGIANLAAVSGSTSQQASTAMYQLSQALAAGTVKLMDWNSVVNAGMGGDVFQNALKETARLHGVAIDQMIEDEGSFRETLRNEWITSDILTETLGKFTTSGVNEYIAEGTSLTADAIKQIRTEAKTYEDAAVAIAEKTGKDKDQIKELISLSQTAEDAATKVKTFSQLMDTLKEAVQSGWTQTWQLIVGDFDEAKELFTEVSDFLGNIINKSAVDRNERLTGALSTSWQQLTGIIEDAGMSSEDFKNQVIETAKSHNIAIEDMIKDQGSLAKVLSSGKIDSGIVVETIKKLASLDEATTETKATLEEFQDVVNQVINGDFGNGQDRIDALTAAGYDYATVQGFVNEVLLGTNTNLSDLSDAQLKSMNLTDDQVKTLRKLAEQAGDSGTSIGELMKNMARPSGRELIIDSFRSMFGGLVKSIGAVHDAWVEVFPPATSEEIYHVIEVIHSLVKGMEITDTKADNLKRTLKGVFAILSIFTSITGGAFKIALKLIARLLGIVDLDILSVTAAIGDAIVAFKDWLYTDSLLAKGFQVLWKLITSGAGKVKEFVLSFKSIPGVSKKLDAVQASASKIFDTLSDNNVLVTGFSKLTRVMSDGATNVYDWITAFAQLPATQNTLKVFAEAALLTYDGLKTFFKGGSTVILDFIDRVKSMDGLTLDNIQTALEDFRTNVIGYFLNIGDQFDSLGEVIDQFKDNALNYLSSTIDGFDEFKDGLVSGLDKIKEVASRTNIGSLLGIVAGAGLIKSMLSIAKIFNGVGNGFATFISYFSGLKGVFKSLKGVFKTLKFNIAAGGVLKIAEAIGILAAAIAILSFLDQGKVWSSVAALLVLTTGLVALTEAIVKIKGVKKFEIVSKSIIILSGAMLVLALALKTLDGMDPLSMLAGVTALTTLCAAIAGFSILMGKYAPALAKNSLSLIAFAVSLRIMVSALKAAEKLEVSKLPMTLGVLIVAMGMLGTVAFLSKGLGKGAGVSILAMAVALRIVIKAINELADMDLASAAKGIGLVIVIFGMFVGMMFATKLAGKNASKAGAGLLAMAAAMILIVVVIKMVAGIDPLSIMKGIGTITMIMVLFAGIIFVSQFAGKNAAKAGVMLLAISVAIGVLTVCIIALSMLDPMGLARAVSAIALLMACFAGLMVVTQFAKTSKTLVSTLIAMSVAIGILSIALAGLSLIDTTKLAGATVALSIVMGMFALLMAVSAVVGKSIAVIAVLAVAVGLMGGMLYLLGQLPAEQSLAAAGSLSMVILALSGACLLLAAIPLPGALAALANLGILVSGLLLILVALGGIYMIPGVQDLMQNGIAVLGMLGEGIGAFGGGIAKGFMNGVSSAFPQIGSDLSAFMTNGQAFFDGLSKLDSSVVDSAKSVAGMILALTAASVIDGISSFLGGDVSFADFGNDLIPFGESLAAFSQAISDGKVDGEAVKNAANAATGLVDLADSIPNSEGWLSKIVGDNNIDDFGKKIVPFGKALSDFSSSVSEGKVDPDGIKNAAEAAKALVEMADTIPEEGGVAAFFAGDNDLSGFGAMIVPFGKSLAEFSSSVSGGKVDAESIKHTADAIKALVEMADKIPESGGLKGLITGEKDIGSFSDAMIPFGNAMSDFSSKVGGDNIDPEGIKNVTKAAGYLVDLSNEMPNGGTAVASNLRSFGSGLVDFSTSVAGLDSKGLKSAIDALSEVSPKFKQVAQDMMDSYNDGTKSKADSVKDTLSELVDDSVSDLKEKINDFKDPGEYVVTTINAGIEPKRSTVSDKLVSILKDAITAVRGLYDNFKQAGSYLVDGFAEGVGSNTYKASLKSEAMAAAALDTAKHTLDERSPSKESYKIGDFYGKGFVNAIGDYASKAYRAGSGMAESAKLGLSNAVSRITDIINGDIDTQPTIRPVLDLSGVEAGTGRLNTMFSRSQALAISGGMVTNQNGNFGSDVVTAIEKLRRDVIANSGSSYAVNGITYDDGSNISSAVQTLVRAAKVERRL